MDCKQYEALLDRHQEGSLTQAQRADLQTHLAVCPACRAKHTVLDDLRGLDLGQEVPAGFSASWRQELIKEDENPVKQMPRFTRALAMAAALFVLVGGTYLAGQQRRQNAQITPVLQNVREADLYAAMSMADMAQESAAGRSLMKEGQTASQQKIIRRVWLELSTREFEQDTKSVLTALSSAGGRVEQSGQYTSAQGLRTANYTLRVPEAGLDSLLATLRGLGRQISFSESAEDVSEQYADSENRLLTQRTKMTRLQELLTKAESVEDLIQIEDAISNTQYQIDSLTGQLQGLDSRIQDATLNLTLNESTPLESAQDQEATLWQRLVSGATAAFSAFLLILSDAVVFLGIALPYLLALAVLVLLIRYIIKRRKHS